MILFFRGEASQQKKQSEIEKLEVDLKYHKELHELYCLITKLAIICYKKNLKLVIENPAGTQHYLNRYWCLKPSLIDDDRTKMGDYYKKPTQYWFINCEPKYNFIFEGVDVKIKKRVLKQNKVNRSMISPDYANRFIREFLI